jgi:protein TonB
MTDDDPPAHISQQSLPARLLAALRPGRRWFALVVFALALMLGLAVSSIWVHTRAMQPTPAAAGATIPSDPTHPPLPAPMPGALSPLPPAMESAPGAAYIASSPSPAEPEAADTSALGSMPAVQAAPASPAVATPAEGDSDAQVIERSEPNYPIEALNAHEEGEVRLQVALDALGNVEDVRIASSSGSRQLDRAAIESVRSWHFRPAHRAGVAVSGMIDVPVDFRIDEH